MTALILEEPLRRIAAALERQVEQQDESVERFTSYRETDLARIKANRDDDLTRITSENEQARAEVKSLADQFDKAMALIREFRDDLRLLGARIAEIEAEGRKS